MIQEQFPEVYERHKSQFEPYNVVTQIKGPGNRAPDKAALPYLQDFVRSGKWSDVRDYYNAGLVDFVQDSDVATRMRQAGREVPRYATNEEIEGWLREYPEVPQ